MPFTIPEDDILKVRPLMTMVGGRIIVLQESLAREFGTQQVGPVYTFKDEDVEHIGKPLSEIAQKFKTITPTPREAMQALATFGSSGRSAGAGSNSSQTVVNVRARASASAESISVPYGDLPIDGNFQEASLDRV